MPGFETLAGMPSRVTSGDSVSLALVEFSNQYPPADYALTVVIARGTGAPVSTSLADTAGVHTGTINFAGIAAGMCSYVIRAVRKADNAVASLETGSVTIDPDITTQDPRSHAEKVLEAIEALIEGRATKDVSSYSIAGRSLTRLSPKELVEWRSFYKNEVARKRAAGQPNGGRRITLARFV